MTKKLQRRFGCRITLYGDCICTSRFRRGTATTLGGTAVTLGFALHTGIKSENIVRARHGIEDLLLDFVSDADKNFLLYELATQNTFCRKGKRICDGNVAVLQRSSNGTAGWQWATAIEFLPSQYNKCISNCTNDRGTLHQWFDDCHVDVRLAPKACVYIRGNTAADVFSCCQRWEVKLKELLCMAHKHHCVAE